MRSFAVVAALLLSCKEAKTAHGTGSSPRAATQPPAPTIPGVELAELPGAGAIPYRSGAPLLVVAPGQMSLEGRQVIAMKAGVVNPADKEGGSIAPTIPRLTVALASAKEPDGELDIAFDRRLTVGLLFEVLSSARQKDGGGARFKILARAGGALVAIPIALPAKASPSRGEIVSVADLEWSSLGDETVVEKIRASYMKGITSCYKDVEGADPSTAGSPRLSFTVTRTGRLDRPSADGTSPAVEACLEKSMTAWTFPIPRDREGNQREAFFTVGLKPAAAADETTTVDPPVAVEPRRAPPHISSRGELPIGLCVAVTDTELSVWSFSGLEGTLTEPMLTIARSKATAVADMGQALAEIVSRRWGDRDRPETAREIVVVMVDRTTTIEAITEVLAAVRATPDGKELFRDVLVSPGFE